MKGNSRKKVLIIFSVFICFLLVFGLLNKNFKKNQELSIPTASISYDIETLTNQDVSVKLINPSTEITITNNDGKDTYTFTKNGEFTFTFVDKEGNEGSAIASVSWIDKEAPTATITYDIKDKTNQNVIATISNFSEEVTILNNNEQDSYTFNKNGKFTFKFMDKAGNISSLDAEVNWIDKEVPIAFVSFENNKEANMVKAILIETNKEITVLNNDGKNFYEFTENGSFEFVYQDEAGNIGRTIAKVNWLLPENKQNSQIKDNNAILSSSNDIEKEETEETKKPTPRVEKNEEKVEEEKIQEKVEVEELEKNINNTKKIILIVSSILLLVVALIIIKQRKAKIAFKNSKKQ